MVQSSKTVQKFLLVFSRILETEINDAIYNVKSIICNVKSSKTAQKLEPMFLSNSETKIDDKYTCTMYTFKSFVVVFLYFILF